MEVNSKGLRKSWPYRKRPAGRCASWTSPVNY